MFESKRRKCRLTSSHSTRQTASAEAWISIEKLKFCMTKLLAAQSAAIICSSMSNPGRARAVIQGNLKSIQNYDPRLKPSCKTKPEGFSDPFCYNFHHLRLSIFDHNNRYIVFSTILKGFSNKRIDYVFRIGFTSQYLGNDVVRNHIG
jgi:hypothetical protein